MKTTKSILVSVILLLSVTFANAQTLIPELKSFEKIVNQKWIGHFDDPDEKNEIHLTIESILDGVAILETVNVPEAENYTEQILYYWDPEIKAIAATRITNNRWLFRFVVTPKDSVFLYEGTRYNPGGEKSNTSSMRVLQKDGSFKVNVGNRDSRTFIRAND
ncbi:hypothetical protein ACFLS7_03950 [Bacteroidota bacterium]